ncbi:MAG: hypothetical protein ACE5H3_03110 [Planctomycetota bacterium]
MSHFRKVSFDAGGAPAVPANFLTDEVREAPAEGYRWSFEVYLDSGILELHAEDEDLLDGVEIRE